MHTREKEPEMSIVSGALPAAYTELKRKPFEPAAGTTPGYTTATVRFFGGTTDGEVARVDFKTGENNIKPAHEEIVQVTDLRTLQPQTTLKFEGCEWIHAPASLTEEHLLNPNKDEVNKFVQETYWPECAELVKQRIGAVKAVPYQWRHRRMETNEVKADGKNTATKPVQNFHVDNDAETAEGNLRKALGDDEAERWLGKRWGIVNIWRPVGETVKQWPLALLDSHTIDRAQVTESILTVNNYKPNSKILRYSPDFRFYYCSDLTPDEALLFVDFDSQPDGMMVGVAHGAFEDHSSPKDAPLRRSTEVRVLVLMEELD